MHSKPSISLKLVDKKKKESLQLEIVGHLLTLSNPQHVSLMDQLLHQLLLQIEPSDPYVHMQQEVPPITYIKLKHWTLKLHYYHNSYLEYSSEL